MPMPAHQETTATVDHLSRRMWRALEPYHALVYFIPETRQRTDALGLKGGWMSYFGTRAAPLGPVPAEVVTALFYHFHPSMVRRAIPDAWSYASPDALTEARVAAAGEGLRRLLGAAVESDAITEAAELAAAAAVARRHHPARGTRRRARGGADGRRPVALRGAGNGQRRRWPARRDAPGQP